MVKYFCDRCNGELKDSQEDDSTRIALYDGGRCVLLCKSCTDDYYRIFHTVAMAFMKGAKHVEIADS